MDAVDDDHRRFVLMRRESCIQREQLLLFRWAMAMTCSELLKTDVPVCRVRLSLYKTRTNGLKTGFSVEC
jgi:hypothetical protein